MKVRHFISTTRRRLAPRRAPPTTSNATPASRRPLPAALLLSLLVGLYAARPLLESRIAEGADTLLHLYRLAQVDALLEQGILFSRWSPDLAYGYGYPLFNYYAPLSYYAAEILHLAGLELHDAFIAAFVLIFLAASVGTFLWVRELTGAPAAIVSAAAYVLSPYLMINLLHRGALAEAQALALFPLLFWLTYRAVIDRRWGYRLAMLLLFSALILTHNISALIFTPVLIAYILLLEVGLSRPGDRNLAHLGHALGRHLWLLLLAIILSAWYWLPALAEQDLVQISQTFGPEDFRFENNFLTLGELLSGPFFLDVKLGNQHIPHALNLVALILAVFGTGSLAIRAIRRIDRLHVSFATIVVLMCTLFILSISEPVWDLLPLIKFLQFPWRFLGVATLLIALLAGYGISQLHFWLGGRPLAITLTTAGSILVLVLYIIPWTFVERLEPIDGVTMADSVAHELKSGALGTTSAGEYLPVNVRQLPGAAQIQAAQGEERLAPDSLPGGATVVESHYAPLDYRLVIDSPAPYTALFNTFYFEGWVATIDGARTALFPAAGSGLIGLDIPAGRHTLELAFQSTPLRRLAVAISLAGLALVAATVIRGRFRAPPAGPERPRTTAFSGSFVVAILGVLLAGILAREFFLDRYAPANSRYDGTAIADANANLNVNFDDSITIIGMDWPAEVPADEEFDITLYWRAIAPDREDYSVSLVLLDGAGNLLGQSDNQHIGNAPSSHWRLGKYIADEHTVSLLPGAPPAAYEVAVAVYHYGRPDDRLDVLDMLGNPVGQLVPIGQIDVMRPGRPQSAASLDLPGAIDVPVGPGVNLVGYRVVQDSVQAGESITVDLYWQAEGAPAADLSTELRLRNAAGDAVSAGRVPLVPAFPTSRWQAGDLWLGRHTVAIPPTVDADGYTLLLGEGGQNEVELATLSVTVPERILEPPQPDSQADVRFGDVARLVGYDAPASAGTAEPLGVTIYWQSQGQTRDNYRSIVQLLDDEGRFVTGSDQIPAAWQRPTTGWIEGEYIADRHSLAIGPNLPPGLYQLAVGLYDARTSQRLLTPDGRDLVTLDSPIAVSLE